MALLLVEDDPQVAWVVTRLFEEGGRRVDVAGSVADAITRLTHGTYPVIVLELRLPDGDGLEVLRAARARAPATAALVVSCRDDEATLVHALDAGADDYVVKPVAPAVLQARLRALERRCSRSRDSAGPPAVLQQGLVTLNRLTRCARIGTARLDLTKREYRILECLLLARGEVTTRTHLESQLWEPEERPHSNGLDVHLYRLRRKLARHTHRVTIQVARGRGFRLVARGE